jgi:threonine aldolase
MRTLAIGVAAVMPAAAGAHSRSSLGEQRICSADPTRRSVEVTPLGSKAVYLVPSGSTAPVLLAHSATIEPGSLAAIPGHIYWVEADAAHTFGAP